MIYGNLTKLSDSSHSAYFQALGADLNSDWRIRESGENPLQPRYCDQLSSRYYCYHCSFRMGRLIPALRSIINMDGSLDCQSGDLPQAVVIDDFRGKVMQQRSD